MPSPIFCGERNPPDSNSGPAQLNSIDLVTCPAFSVHLHLSPSPFSCPAPFLSPAWATPDGVASSRGGRGGSQRLRVRHADVGGGGACPPGPRPARGHAVSGKVIQGLTDRELHVFDMFEDEEYVKTTVEVSLTDASVKSLAYAYIWGNEGDPDLYGEWDFEEWRKVHLKDYLEMTQEFMEELGQF